VMRRAAAFWTDCRRLIKPSAMPKYIGSWWQTQCCLVMVVMHC